MASVEQPPAAVAWHLVVLGGLPFATRRLEPGELLLGRSVEVGWRLEHPSISRKHCRLLLAEGGLQIEDAGSRLGTKVNYETISAPTALRSGDRIQLGPVILGVGVGEPPVRAEQTATVDDSLRAPVFFHGKPALQIPLADGLQFGRDEKADVRLEDAAVSRNHAALRSAPHGFLICDLKSRAGSTVNGRRFDEHLLVIGDRVQFGPFHFRFDGRHLVRVPSASGSAVEAVNLRRHAGTRLLLSDVSLRIAPGRFVGILGPSGAGKSTLLHALCGLRPADSGQALVDGIEVALNGPPPQLGYVPQEDIVHGELTVAQALAFNAGLRLAAGTLPLERQKLILQTMRRLGLAERANVQIHRLSGGQRKRVSVAVELLGCPSVLFLDEPTSGLDPATEFKLMEVLRDLADGGCTIVCTTHVVENVYLMDQLLVLSAGALVFDGTPQEVRDHFGVTRLTAIYDKLDQPPAAGAGAVRGRAMVQRRAKIKRAPALPILLRRQWAILMADRRNLAMLVAQPVWIAALVCWVSRDVSLIMFFGMLATLWFGCSNAAQEIVREIPIYRRGRLIGVGRHAYLASKFTFLAAVTLAQAALLLAALQLFSGGLPGTTPWQAGAFIGTALAAVGIGCAISAWARSVMQSVIAVPLLLIPLIIFSGYTVPAHEMRPEVRVVAAVTPSFAAQRMLDVSLLWHEKIERDFLADHWAAVRNLKTVTAIKSGDAFTDAGPALEAAGILLLWSGLGYAAAAMGLKRQERA
jgi:ABC-type multidrug transport system ATPase subunit/pSer/pThr/pTyr-binding forkhead associated (FHA) protein